MGAEGMNVTISGGVHGNELLGIYLVKSLMNEPLEYPDLNVDFLLANPKAIKECRRYIDRDLNRSFNKQALSNDSELYEHERAKVIKKRLEKCDFLIDLHTTTANMGISVILSSDDPLSKNLAKILALEYEDVRVVRWFSNDEGAFINSIVPHSITIEVGPVCQGVLDARLFFKTKRVLLAALRILQMQERTNERVECYDILHGMDFPRKDGEMWGMIHPQLMGRDYELLHPGDPIFLTFDEKEIFYEGEPLHPLFINEAAYYEKRVAFYLCTKSSI